MLVILFKPGQSDAQRALKLSRQDMSHYIVIHVNELYPYHLAALIIRAANERKNIIFNNDFGSKTRIIEDILKEQGVQVLCV